MRKFPPNSCFHGILENKRHILVGSQISTSCLLRPLILVLHHNIGSFGSQTIAKREWGSVARALTRWQVKTRGEPIEGCFSLQSPRHNDVSSKAVQVKQQAAGPLFPVYSERMVGAPTSVTSRNPFLFDHTHSHTHTHTILRDTHTLKNTQQHLKFLTQSLPMHFQL